MTNIDKLKAAAAKAVDNFDPNMFVETRDVLALLDELEAVENRNGWLEKHSKTTLEFREAALRANRSLRVDLDIAEKRIAELEAREVVLPSTQDVHPLGPQSAKIFCEFHRSIVNRCADEIRKVGVKVSIKGN